MTAPATATITEQNIWQRRAAGVLMQLLMRHHDLPAIRWAIDDAGCGLTGTIAAHWTEQQIREAFTAWCDALRLTPRQSATPAGEVRLIAQGRADNVRIVVAASYWPAEDDGEARP